MIAKAVLRNTNDRYGRLAEYLAAASDPGEKLDQFWTVGCAAGETLEDLELAIAEIEATQAMNTRSKKPKTYHLVVSFRDEKPSLEALKDMEQEFAKALGFEEHQRIIATHKNTDNFHMHIAYNQVNPSRFNNHSPSHDYEKLARVCRAMEIKYGLKIDNGVDETRERDPEALSPKAREIEALTWEQSFEGFLKENKKELMAIRQSAKSWEELHQGLARFNIALKPRGNGLIFQDLGSKARVKASTLDRSYSKAALERDFGPFEKINKKGRSLHTKKTYQRRPLTKHPKQARLWKRYLGQLKKKDSLALKVFRTWREYLTAEALTDPMAIAIIAYHKQLLKVVEKGFAK